MNEKIILTPIAFIKSEFIDESKKITKNTISQITLTDEFNEDAFEGISDFSHLEIVWYFDRSKITIKGKTHPRGNAKFLQKGIFSVRSPNRPNHIATTIVELLKIEGKTLHVYGLDALDGTPVLDIKPVVSRFLPEKEIKQADWITQ